MILNLWSTRMELAVRKKNILFILIKESFATFANIFILHITDLCWINVASRFSMHVWYTQNWHIYSKHRAKALLPYRPTLDQWVWECWHPLHWKSPYPCPMRLGHLQRSCELVQRNHCVVLWSINLPKASRKSSIMAFCKSGMVKNPGHCIVFPVHQALLHAHHLLLPSL